MTLYTLSGKRVCPFRVGDIIVTETAENPSNTYTGTTWEQVCVGRVPVGVSTSEKEFDTVNKTGGSKDLQAHHHGYTINIQHSDGNSVSGEALTSGLKVGGRARYHSSTSTMGTGESGNLQPYETKYFWKRLT